MFRDKRTCEAEFFAADIFADGGRLGELEGGLDVVYAGAFFHLFDLPEQEQIAERVAGLLKAETGVMMLGRNVDGGSYTTTSGGRFVQHDKQSWQALWKEVGRATGSQWDVWVEEREVEGVRQMCFCVTRK